MTSKKGHLSSLTELPFSMVHRNIGLPHLKAQGVSAVGHQHPIGPPGSVAVSSFHSVFPKSLRSDSEGKRPGKKDSGPGQIQGRNLCPTAPTLKSSPHLNNELLHREVLNEARLKFKPQTVHR